MNTAIFKPEEKAIFTLRELYRSRGYLPFKMSKFEEYELYAENKDFLVSSNIITFNDKNGRLMALKPDVTLSILKNYTEEKNCTEKVYYNENVYRPDASTHEYKEIPQTGLECIGEIDTYHIFEVISLAAESLASISDDYVLDISHLGITAAILGQASCPETLEKKILECIGAKSVHELQRILRENDVDEKIVEQLTQLIGIYAPMNETLGRLEGLCGTERFRESLENLRELCALLSETDFASHIRFDFSIANDMTYYDSIVFQGYIPGIPESILSGGQYDNLLHKFNKKGGAIGFAIYLDLLEHYRAEEYYDADILLIYDDFSSVREIAAAVKKLSADGKRVTAQRAIPEKLRVKKILKLTDGRIEA